MDNYAEQVTENYADQAIARMRSPQEMVIICVDVTNKCDLHCSNCTRLLKNQTEFWEMSPENFRMALRSLRGYPGVIAMIGGNPCMNKYFPELCAIFVEEIPNQKQRGLWSNNIFDYQQVVAETFGMFNLNPHNDKRGIKSFERLKQIIPQITYFKGHSHHAPLLTAMQDLYPDPEEMWRLIQGCDINRQWSASIVQNRGELRAYFCEVAASFDLARGEDHGIPVAEGWWLRTMPEFSDQVKHFCPGCGVPARLKDHLDIGDRRHLHQPRDRERAERELSQKLPRGHALPESWRLHRFEAVDKESAQAEPTPSTVPPALKGNYLSHLACARLAQRFDSHVVIAEDDTVFCNVTAFWLERLIDTLPEDSWDVILTDIYVADATRKPRLLKTRRRCVASNTIDVFAATAWEGAFVGAGCYVINRRAKDKFLATLALPEIAHAFDLCLRQAMLTGQLKGIITFPFLTTISTEGDDTSVQPDARIWESTLYHCFRRLVWIGAENPANQIDRVPPQLRAVPDALVDSEVEALAAIMRPLLSMQMNWQ